MAIERSRSYNGFYHVLHGVSFRPLDGIGPDDLKIEPLLIRLEQEGIEEVILATNFTVEGEATAHYLADLCRAKGGAGSRDSLTAFRPGVILSTSMPETVQHAVDGAA